jgi:hypothetical protein
MLAFLLNNSISLIGLIVGTVLVVSSVREYAKKKDMNISDALVFLRQRLNEIGNELILKLISGLLITLAISLISFREIWSNDVFHVVFVCSLLKTKTEELLKRIVE